MSDKEAAPAVQPSTWRDMPPGIPYIVGNEAAERFSFYGMKAILFVYMTKYLLDSSGQSAPMNPEDARSALHWFVASAYFFPLIGAVLSDLLLGKYRTIFWLSLLYCLGHLALAALPGRFGLVTGLTLIAIGAGGIKPCVSALVGDQFSDRNKDLLPRVFSWFYFSINFGAFFSTIITPILLKYCGPHVAFGLPGVLMFLATLILWLGRNKFVHVKPGGLGFVRETFSLDGLKALSGLIPLFLFVAIFWALYDQTASAWVEQADSMDRKWMGLNWLSSQIQAINPILVLAMIPACTYGVYPAVNRFFRLTPLRKVAIGFVITAFAFGLSASIEMQITGGKLISNATVENKGGEGPQKTTVASVAEDTKEHELVMRLREHRAWNIKSVSWKCKPAEPPKDQPTKDQPIEEDIAIPLVMRAEVGTSPKGPWVTHGTCSFNSKSTDSQLIEFPEAISAMYVRLVIGPFPIKSQREVIDWKSDQTINILAAEASPPKEAHAHAAAVWPDVAAIGYKPNISLQLVAYVFLTLAEVMVSITCLEFSYTQAPNKMKSLVMSFYMLSVSLGNALTAVVNILIQNEDGTSKLPGSSYYWFFTGLMLVASVGFLFVVATYREKTYIQSQANTE